MFACIYTHTCVFSCMYMYMYRYVKVCVVVKTMCICSISSRATLKHQLKQFRALVRASQYLLLKHWTRLQGTDFETRVLKRGSTWTAPSYQDITLRVQVPNYKVSTHNQNYDSQYEVPEYLMVRYFGPLGLGQYQGWTLGSLKAWSGASLSPSSGSMSAGSTRNIAQSRSHCPHYGPLIRNPYKPMLTPLYKADTSQGLILQIRRALEKQGPIGTA